MISNMLRTVDTVASFVFLNLLWLLGCVPIVTAFPSTAAMMAVAKEWSEGDERQIVGPFFTLFRKHFKQGLALGLVLIPIGAVLAVDVAYVFVSERTLLTYVVYVVTLLFGFVYLATLVFLFPLMITSHYGLRVLIWNSMLLGLGRLATTLKGLTLIAAAVALGYLLPFTVLASGSVVAYAIYRLCSKSLERVAPGILET